MASRNHKATTHSPYGLWVSAAAGVRLSVRHVRQAQEYSKQKIPQRLSEAVCELQLRPTFPFLHVRKRLWIPRLRQ
ncbi:hypothetical protein GH5_05164 [Leishmania sp. Ghana 2012 LV757]|uniref:hypothetical protein n=1 Tax=Leishmania sp. Ghana 2012 LV757 TaxID=2803181 RepID=UPI001B3EE64F|nr:hypothetical protein GH5_05164 [Leishmania sp. Ghana 2012 LV757]